MADLNQTQREPAPEEPRLDGQPGDRELVERAQQGDGPAFAMLVERHQRQLYRLALRMTGSEADAQDVLQEAFPCSVAKRSFPAGCTASRRTAR